MHLILRKQTARLQTESILEAPDRLRTEYNWRVRTLYRSNFNSKNEGYPINCYLSPVKGNALWLISGVHGEEPAGPNAVARNIDLISNLGGKIPFVLMPLCNPVGYSKNWRYPRSPKYEEGKDPGDVQDADPFIPDKETGKFSRLVICNEARAISQEILKLSKDYKPIIALNLHEDDKANKAYVYAWGNNDQLKRSLGDLILNLLEKHIPVHREQSYRTRFNEEIQSGIISNSHDGSIDELLACPMAFTYSGQQIKGPNARVVFVVETPSREIGLQQRIKAHEEVLLGLERLIGI